MAARTPERRCRTCGRYDISPYELWQAKDAAYNRGIAWAFGFHAGRDFGRSHPGVEATEYQRRRLANSCDFLGANGAEDSYAAGYLKGQENPPEFFHE